LATPPKDFQADAMTLFSVHVSPFLFHRFFVARKPLWPFYVVIKIETGFFFSSLQTAAYFFFVTAVTANPTRF
jgi:hypothetical protein